MSDLYTQAIENYTKDHQKFKEKNVEQNNLVLFYKTHRREYLCSMMLICSLMPCFTAVLLGIVPCTGDLHWHPYTIRLMILGLAAFCSVIIAPIVVKYQQKPLQKYNNKLSGKTPVDIMLDDFEASVRATQTNAECFTTQKIIKYLQAELSNKQDCASVVNTAEQEEFVNKEKIASTYDEADKYALLKSQYAKELENETKLLTFIDFFSPEFKCNWLSDLLSGLMFSLLFAMVWDVPVLILVLQGTSNISMTGLILDSVLVPLILGLAGPFVLRYLRRKNVHDAFCKAKIKLQTDIDTTQYYYNVKENVQKNILNIQEKIALTTVKLINARGY